MNGEENVENLLRVWISGDRQRRQIGFVVPRGAWVAWYTADSLRNVALIRPGLTPGPPSPSGKALASGTTHQSLPLGGRWTRSGRMRATSRKQSVVY